jgi:hypothetical protein
LNILKKLFFHLSLSLFIAVSFLFPITKIIDYISKYQPDVTINFFLSNFNSIVMLIVVTVIGLLTGYLNINILKIYILFYYFWPMWYVILDYFSINDLESEMLHGLLFNLFFMFIIISINQITIYLMKFYDKKIFTN